MLIPENIVRFKAVRSSGPGGQRVNRRATKVQAWVRIADLPLSEEDKRYVRERLLHRINKRDELEAVYDEERFQVLNKAGVITHLNAMLEMALVRPTPRIPTEPTRGAEKRRHIDKEMRSEKKQQRHVRLTED
jgi:ribosome-associated protein